MRIREILSPRTSAATILIRLSVGAVFLAEGIQKFLYPDDVGAGRFARMGFAAPEVIAPLVGSVEIVAGMLVLAGLATRAAAVPLIATMLTALVTTKLPILLGHDLGPFPVRSLDRYGFWAMAHEARTDWAMLMGSLYLLIVGAGRWSADAMLAARRDRRDEHLLEVSRLLPQGRVAVVPGSGHTVLRSQPDLMLALISGFLKEPS